MIIKTSGKKFANRLSQTAIRESVAQDLAEFMRQGISEAEISLPGIRGSEVKAACEYVIGALDLPIRAELKLGKVVAIRTVRS